MQPVYNIAEICFQKQVRDFVVSPGSRCAPLTISLVRHKGITTKTISDERSAAFIALGMAQHKKQTVGLVCTSGSAAYNYAPAIAEAYYQQVPLLILTADRPPEWIDQLDGQTIRQTSIYGSHVKHSFNFPPDLTHPDAVWHAERILNEAINLAEEFPQGPVHINIPLREPFYPEKEIVFDRNVKIIHPIKGQSIFSSHVWKQLEEEYKNYSKVLVIAGQQPFEDEVNKLLSQLSKENHLTVIADIISNISAPEIVNHHDAILACGDEELLNELQPDLLITFGKSVISKSLKTFIRKNKSKAHWHVQPSGNVADTYQALTKTIQCDPVYFFQHLQKEEWKQLEDYKKSWFIQEARAIQKQQMYFKEAAAFSEFKAIHEVFTHLPSNSLLHLANSMTVRYANYITLKTCTANIEVFANRGTSGIDGTISTAIGAALATDKLVTVITGDLAFFYDRNAWWNNYIPNNLRVIVLNNHGGGIFRMIDGPSRQPELEEYFETRQSLNAENTAKDFHLDYSLCNNEEQLNAALSNFFDFSDRSKVMEIETDAKLNTDEFKRFKKHLSQ